MSSHPPRPPFVFDSRSVPEHAGSYPGSEEQLSPGRDLGRAAGLERVAVHLERVPPGTRTSWPHAESLEEEWVYVLEGEVSLWLDGHVHLLRAGDFVGLRAGTGITHTVLNDGDRDAVLLAGGETRREGNRIFYPLHPQRREQIGARWWDDVPARELGPHDGAPRRRG